MPHVIIRHFPADLTLDQQAQLLATVTEAIQLAFDVAEGAVSISLEAIPPQDWTERVYLPEIVGRKDLLRKAPTY